MKYLIACLGNIGVEYDDTRHNIGFKVADYLNDDLKGTFTTSRLAQVSELRYKGRTMVVIKPTTYMNLSGKAVAVFARRNQINPEEILIVSDDLDLPLGRMRLRSGGSDGGHNGLKSVIAELGSASFKRLRIGIGHQDSGTTADHVLGSFTADENVVLQQVLVRAVEAVNCVLSAGMNCAMNKYNAKPQQIEEKTETTL